MMNKIKEKENNILTLSNNETKEIYLFTDKKVVKTINLSTNSHLILYHYHVNKDAEIEINLNGEQAEIEYHFSMINYDNNTLKMKINHNYKNTISNVYNHGVNVENQSLSFKIVGKVPKDKSGCICNQENQIINIADGKSSISPSLLIDNYDVSSSHSAYIGKFKDDILFYLMSRGISWDKSIELLIKGLLLNQGSMEKDEVIKMQKEIENI